MPVVTDKRTKELIKGLHDAVINMIQKMRTMVYNGLSICHIKEASNEFGKGNKNRLPAVPSRMWPTGIYGEW